MSAFGSGTWLGGRDSNPDSMVQSHVSYRWTTAQCRTPILDKSLGEFKRPPARAVHGRGAAAASGPLGGGEVQRVQEGGIGDVALSPVLWPEAEQDDPTLPEWNLHEGGPAAEMLIPQQPSRQQPPLPVSIQEAMASAGDWMAFSSDAGTGPTQITLIDAQDQVICVYHVDRVTGSIELKSVRKVGWDLRMEEFNGVHPLPRDIRALLEQR